MCMSALQLYEYLINTCFPYHHQGPNPSSSSRQYSVVYHEYILRLGNKDKTQGIHG
jgi:hypothetical protein